MPKLITASCFLLFWVFYEMSGGADFAPRDRVIVSQAPFAQTPSRNLTYERRIKAPQVTNASYAPVATEPLIAINVRTTPQVVAPAEPVASVPIAELAIETPTLDLRYVAGNRVNLRRGPGTNHAVLDTLRQGTAAEVIATNDLGWAQIRLIESGQTGWIAARLLSEG